MNEKVRSNPIGPTWPPENASFHRIKAIYTPEVIDTYDALMNAAEWIRAFDFHSQYADRVSARFIVQTPLLLAALSAIRDVVEATIPLDGAGRELDTLSIVYLGKNGPDRQPNPRDLRQSVRNVKEAQRRKPLSYEEIMWHVEEQGCETYVLDIPTRTQNTGAREQIVQLYKRFSWTREDTMEILSDPMNIVAAVVRNDEIASVGMAEVKDLQVGSTVIRMAEIADAATLVSDQRKGLYSAVAATLMRELYACDAHVVFGECNGNAPGVLNASKTLWRTFSWYTSQDANLGIKGYLPQHVPIEGLPRSTPYNDLFPSYATKATLRRFLQE